MFSCLTTEFSSFFGLRIIMIFYMLALIDLYIYPNFTLLLYIKSQFMYGKRRWYFEFQIRTPRATPRPSWPHPDTQVGAAAARMKKLADKFQAYYFFFCFSECFTLPWAWLWRWRFYLLPQRGVARTMKIEPWNVRARPQHSTHRPKPVDWNMRQNCELELW